MKPVTSLVKSEILEGLASRSNFRYGQEISKEATFTIEKSNSFNIIARIVFRNSETRTAELSSTPKGLRWKCSCTGRKDLFCKHCVALGFYILREKM